MTKDRISDFRPATRAVHAGSDPDPSTGAVVVPIYQTSTYAQSSPGVTRGYEYSRTDNPTRTAFQDALASLESACYGLAFASGMAAIDVVMKTLRPGDRVLAGDDLYGGTYRLFTTLYRPLGIEFDFVDLSGDFDPEPWIKPTTKMVWAETPTNPLLKVIDIARLAKITRAKNILLAVDNTFMSPALQEPIPLGADLVVHSTTKYVGGHSDTVGGAIVTDNEELYRTYKTIQNSAGAIMGPFDSFIAHRGLKTLPLRMERHSQNAERIAKFLDGHKRVKRVIYPFFENHPHHEIARRQQKMGGGMVSFEIDGGREEALKIVARTEIFTLAESLGGVESLIEHPAAMTHSSIPAEVRAEKGLSDSLIRLSVGIEDAEDLIGDLEKALS